MPMIRRFGRKSGTRALPAWRWHYSRCVGLSTIAARLRLLPLAFAGVAMTIVAARSMAAA
jgi:hypothetical protein